MEAPRLLIVETSGKVGHVALALGPHLLQMRQLEEARRHARDLAPAVGELLRAADWRPRDLQAVLVSRGPGSYTGLRVGIMSAKALAYATGCALLGVDTFAAIAYQAPAEAAVLDVLADAQQDRVYWQRFGRRETGWEPASALTILPVAEWLASRPTHAWATGPGVRLIVGRCKGECIATEAQRDPGPESVLALGLERWQAGERDDVFALEPLYARPSSAEEQWDRRPF